MAKENNPVWRRFLAPALEILQKVRPPEGDFHPQGAWTHQYAVCLLNPERQEKGEHPQPYGKLLLKRNPAEAGRFNLEVEQSIFTRGRSGNRTRASLTCSSDRVASPLRWELRSETLENGAAAGGASVSETGSVRDGMILRSGRGSRKIGAKRALTSNWSLIDAVQRLPFDAAQPLEFDMIEDLDLFKSGQSLRPLGELTLELGGRRTRLHGFRQIGRGILPMHYLLDDQRRLIAATGSLRAIIWDTERKG
ncbi:MAG TPA: hypothetical protein VL285_17860 [Bryobacteraceae bacterium]|jgi:hypothetical protein|nr:hypothetical protein [Bryobacteraceae bacterium]